MNQPITLSPDVAFASIKEEIRRICPDSIVRIHQGGQRITVNVHCGESQGAINHNQIDAIIRKLTNQPFTVNYLPI